jgi:hypothetical protein
MAIVKYARSERTHMTEDSHHDDDHEHGASGGRVTSPMQEYTIAQVLRGAFVLAVGLVLTFGLGLAL